MSRLLFVIALCFTFLGCDFRGNKKLQREVAELREKASAMSSVDLEDIDDRLENHSARLNKTEEGLRRLVAQLTQLARKVDDSRKIGDSQNVDELFKRLEEVERTVKLTSARLEDVEGRLSKVETPDKVENGGKVDVVEYNRLVEAHNNLVDSIKKLNEGINGVYGDQEVSAYSWLHRLKSEVDNMKYGVETVKSEISSIRIKVGY